MAGDSKPRLVWSSHVPKECQTCDTSLDTRFYDAATAFGGWAIMCPTCFHLGPGRGALGPGQGQEYSKQPDGRFAKTAG